MRDFWRIPTDLRLITTCGTVSKKYMPPAKGALLPNGKRPKGTWDIRLPIQKEWDRRFPDMARLLGEHIYLQGAKRQSVYEYNLLVSPRWPESNLGLFQTRVHFDDKPDYNIIDISYAYLILWLNEHPGMKVLLYCDFDWIYPEYEEITLWKP